MSASDDLDDSAGSPHLSHSLSSSHEVDPPRGLKRPAMAPEDEEAPKRQATSQVELARETVFRVLCPVNRAGSVIGKGGANIEQLRKETEAKVQVAESRGDTDFRVIVISSSNSPEEDWAPAQEALLRVFRRIVEGDPDERMDLQNTMFRLLVPGSQIGCLLGKGGSIIKGLREDSGAQIRVIAEQVPRCALPTDEMVQVSGEVSVCQKALRDISDRMRANPPRDLPQRAQSRHATTTAPFPPHPAPLIGRPLVLPHASGAVPLPRLEAGGLPTLGMPLPLLSSAALGLPGGGDCVFRVLFPTARIGGLIGKGGATIKQLQSETGTRIRVEPAVENCEWQTVEIQGPLMEGAPLSGSQEALLAVTELIAGAEAGPVRLLVPSSQVGCLLGKGGTIMQDLRRQSQAQIRIMPRDMLPKCAHNSDELVQVAGPPESLRSALLLIGARIRDNPLKEPHKERHSASDARMSDRGKERERMPLHVPRERRPRSSSRERYAHGGPSDEEGYRRGGDREERGRDGPRERGRERPRERDREHEREWRRGEGDRRREERHRQEDRSRREEGGGYRARADERPHASTRSHQSGDLRSRGPPSFVPTSMGASTSLLHISVPSASVGSIIGKGGANISQIRQISGAKVKLHDATAGDSRVRMLEISGTLEQTQMAQGLLQTIMQDASLNGGLDRSR